MTPDYCYDMSDAYPTPQACASRSPEQRVRALAKKLVAVGGPAATLGILSGNHIAVQFRNCVWGHIDPRALAPIMAELSALASIEAINCHFPNPKSVGSLTADLSVSCEYCDHFRWQAVGVACHEKKVRVCVHKGWKGWGIMEVDRPPCGGLGYDEKSSIPF